MSHVSDAASSEIVPSAKNSIRVVWMIGTIRYQSQPKVPVQSFRNFWAVFRIGRPLRPEGTIGPIMDLKQFAYTTFINPFFYEIVTTNFPPCKKMRANSCLFCRINRQSRFIHSIGNWFMYDNSLTFFH